MFAFLLMIVGVTGHGRLIDPPGRATMWRYGFNTPMNDNDHQLSCGGRQIQWTVNGGRCGVCGDRWDGMRDHEAGGKYATGIITRVYKSKTAIPIVVEMTANHLGWFEFRICKNDNIRKRATEECFNQNLLHFEDGSTRLFIGNTHGKIVSRLSLPEHLTCTQCVLQWKYHTGNNWGLDKHGKGCRGCGEKQEEFYGCSDIAITETGSETEPAKITTPPTTSTKTSEEPTSITQQRTTPVNSVVPGSMNCRSVGLWAGQYTKDVWCSQNCAQGYCPEVHCKCGDYSSGRGCRGIGLWEGNVSIDNWCKHNCALQFCPKVLCKCYV